MYNRWVSGYGLVVEHVLAKDEIRVRFPVAAHRKRSFIFRESKAGAMFFHQKKQARRGRGSFNSTELKLSVTDVPKVHLTSSQKAP